MKKANDPARQVGIELILGVAVVAAGFFFLVDPMEAKLVKIREEMASLTTQAGQPGRSVIPPDRAAGVLKESQDLIKSVEARSAVAKDQSTLFAAMMELAGKHKIQIVQLQPVTASGKREGRRGAVTPPPAGAAPPAGAKPGSSIDAACVRYSITANGTYSDIISFVGALQTELGFTRVRTIRVDPGREAGGTIEQVQLDTEHYAFGAGAIALASNLEEQP